MDYTQVDEVLAAVEEIVEKAPRTMSEEWETSADVMEKGIAIPGALGALVERFASSPNRAVRSNLAGVLAIAADNPTPESAPLIYGFLENTTDWDYGRMLNHALLALRSQAIEGLAWHPPEQTPPVLSRFLLHCLEQEPDSENDNADTAVNVLWSIHNWAEDRGGLRSVFSPDERQAFRDKFDEVGLEPGPILEALGKD